MKIINLKLVLNVKLQIVIINALNAILQIIVSKNLMGILKDNAFAKMVIMMMAKIIYVSNVILVGKKKLKF